VNAFRRFTVGGRGLTVLASVAALALQFVTRSGWKRADV
jgi:hypothetical protein